MFSVRGAQILDQREHLLLRGRREVLLDVQLSDGLAQIVAQGGDTSLPAVLDLLLTVERATVEIEPFLVEGLRQHVRDTDQIVVGEVRPPALHRNRPEQFGQRLDRIQLPHDEFVLRGQPADLQILLPGNRRRQLLELRAAAQVIGEISFATLGGRPMQGGDLRLDVENRFRFGSGFMISRECQQPFDVSRVFCTQFGVDRVGL